MFSTLRHQGNANQNNSEIAPYTCQNHQKTLMIAYAREGEEQGEHSSIANGSAKLYSHFGNQYGSFSES